MAVVLVYASAQLTQTILCYQQTILCYQEITVYKPIINRSVLGIV